MADGLAGGVAAAGLSNSRDPYAEEQVQRQTQALGQYTAQAQATGSIQSLLRCLRNQRRLRRAQLLLSELFRLERHPSDATARQSVLDSAATLASAIQGLANSLSQNAQQLDASIASTANQINSHRRADSGL